MERYIFKNKGRAAWVLQQLNDLIQVYGVATRRDLKELYGLKPEIRDNIFGWTNLDNALIETINDIGEEEYALALPQAFRIE